MIPVLYPLHTHLIWEIDVMNQAKPRRGNKKGNIGACISAGFTSHLPEPRGFGNFGQGVGGVLKGRVGRVWDVGKLPLPWAVLTLYPVANMESYVEFKQKNSTEFTVVFLPALTHSIYPVHGCQRDISKAEKFKEERIWIWTLDVPRLEIRAQIGKTKSKFHRTH